MIDTLSVNFSKETDLDILSTFADIQMFYK